MTFTRPLSDWLRGLSEEDAGRALLGIGIRPEELGAVLANQGIGIRPPILRWTLSAEDLRHRSEADPHSYLDLVRPLEGLRLAVTTDATASEDVVSQLLSAPEVASAFVAVERPPGSLRRRGWRWPYRIGLLGFGDDEADELRAQVADFGMFPPGLLDLRRIEDEPEAVDLLIVEGSLEDAVRDVVRAKPIANAVVVLDQPFLRWPLVESQLATLRATTAAVASALATPPSLADLIGGVVYLSSHGEPFDVALRHAVRGPLLLCAEPDAMEQAALPKLAIRMAREAGEGARASRELGEEPPVELTEAEEGLETASTGAFVDESGEASVIAEIRAELDGALDRIEGVQERWLQAWVGAQRDNTLRPGSNPVSLFIGPIEEGALTSGRAFDDFELPWKSADSFRLTVLFVPIAPEGEVQQSELDLPRFGRSSDVQFKLETEGEDEDVAVRIIVLFRNRVLQTAVLRGRVGARAQLLDRAAIIPSLEGLDERRAFDVALLANHTNGVAELIAHSNSHTSVSGMPALAPLAERIAEQLADAVRLRVTKKGVRSEDARLLLVALAKHGRDLFNLLEEQLTQVAKASRIQLVTAHGGWFLPIELAYPRYAPDDDATICERYLDDPAICDGKCTSIKDRKSVCPNAFWGLSKTIERHHFNPALGAGPQQGNLVLGLGRPRPGKRDLVIERTLLAASRRVTQANRQAVVDELGAASATSWQEWAATLASAETQLLILLPHTDYHRTTLEIADDKLERSHIEAEYVTGAHDDVAPVVLLFGCRTTGKSDDPAGFAAAFMAKGARAVFHSSTDLLNVHASELARRLAGSFIRPGRRPQLLSEALATFRREAVHDGLLSAFAISAYGDADWRI
jgi:hypothetical protein